MSMPKRMRSARSSRSVSESDTDLASFCGGSRQRSRVTEFHIQINGIEVETIRPGGYAHLHKGTGEIVGRLERLHHRPALRQNFRKIAHAFAAIGEAEPQTMTIKRPQAQDVYHRQVIRLHRGLRPFPAACGHA